LLLQGQAFGAGLGEAGGVANSAACVDGGQLGHARKRQLTVGGDEDSVRPARQVGDVAHARHAFEVVMLRIDQPHLPLV